MSNALDRRHVLLAAASVPLLAACGSGSDDAGGGTGATAPTPTPPGSPTPQTPSTGGASPVGDELVETSKVKVGGAAFLDEVVVTQPTEGDFHAFSRTCTHMSCPVTDLKGGNIHCPCHGSMFDPTTGEPVGGPAPSALRKIDIVVQDGVVYEA